MISVTKVKELMEKEKKRANIEMYIEVAEDKNKDVHVLAKRNDGEYVVWTAINTGGVKTSYEAFYNGLYTPDLMEAVNDFRKRVLG